ncbi:MAG: hypothetical protein PHE24_05035 [Patescibacteria group bacterium]|nr:hypothetical protein [Patescibacteria group bacterium]
MPRSFKEIGPTNQFIVFKVGEPFDMARIFEKIPDTFTAPKGLPIIKVGPDGKKDDEVVPADGTEQVNARGPHCKFASIADEVQVVGLIG